MGVLSQSLKDQGKSRTIMSSRIIARVTAVAIP